MSYLIVLPSVDPAYRAACLDGLAPEVLERVVVVDNGGGENLGCAGSWNVGARRVLEERLDWLVILSESTRFGPAGGRDFARALDDWTGRAWVVESEVPVGWHLLGWSRTVLEHVGLFDENFWPAYGEDADVSRRIHLAQAELGSRIGKTLGPPPPDAAWVVADVDAWITMTGHATKHAGVRIDWPSTWGYYEAKWGGLSGRETYSRPFGNPANPLSWWPPVGHPLSRRTT